MKQNLESTKHRHKGKRQNDSRLIPGGALLIHTKDKYMVILLGNEQETQHIAVIL